MNSQRTSDWGGSGIGRRAAGVLAFSALGIIAGLTSVTAAPAKSLHPSATASLADYEAAAKLMPVPLVKAIKNAFPHLQWIGSTDWAWYRRDTRDGFAFTLIDAATGAREPAFDHPAVAAALGKAGVTADAAHLPVTDLTFSDDRSTVTITAGKVVLAWNRKTSTGVASAVPAPPSAVESLSPDGHWAAFRKNDNLWIRDVKTGAERALTTDGAPYFSYGKLSDASLIAVKAMRTGMALPPIGLVWSPDSKRLIIPRLDERNVRPYAYLQSVPPKGWAPVPYTIHRALLGDPAQTVIDYFAIDAATGKTRHLEVHGARGISFESNPDWWSEDGSSAYVLVTGDKGALDLDRIDLATGAVQTVIHETRNGPPVRPNLAIYNAPNVRILAHGKGVIWFSERGGLGRLYLYDGASGQMIRELTPGTGVVFDIIGIDAQHRELYYTGSCPAGEGNPYDRMLYRVSLDGGAPVRLTTPGLDHAITGAANGALALVFGVHAIPPSLSPDFRYFVDTASTVDHAPVTTIRSTGDGREIATVETADISGLEALGYRPPEPFTVKAADGKTDLYGVLYWPPHHAGKGSIPVVDAIYNGPQISAAPHNYTGAFSSAAVAPAALARLGFAVFVMDARGTAMRDRAFQDASYGAMADAGLDDHIAAIRQLAARHPEMDATRVGVYGASFGGYYAADAILRHPDVFSASFAVAGPYDPQGFYSGAYESYQGEPVYADGGHVDVTGDETPVNYAALDLTKLAPGLKGHLALAAGDMDENAPPALTYQLADALEKANKDFDLIIMPNHVHFEMWDPYVARRMWNFFVFRLQHGTPPEGFAITAAGAR